MPALLNVKHEKFATFVASGMQQTKAAIEAGFGKSAVSYSSSLVRRPDIRARVQEIIAKQLKEKTAKGNVFDDLDGLNLEPGDAPVAQRDGAEDEAERIIVTKEWVIRQLVVTALHAKEAGQYGATNKALEMLGKHLGMFDGEEARKLERSKENQKIEEEKKNNAIPVDRLNHLLKEMGFSGTIDLAALTDPQPPRLSARKAKKTNADNTAPAEGIQGGGQEPLDPV